MSTCICSGSGSSGYTRVSIVSVVAEIVSSILWFYKRSGSRSSSISVSIVLVLVGENCFSSFIM